MNELRLKSGVFRITFLIFLNKLDITKKEPMGVLPYEGQGTLASVKLFLKVMISYGTHLTLVP